MRRSRRRCGSPGTPSKTTSRRSTPSSRSAAGPSSPPNCSTSTSPRSSAASKSASSAPHQYQLTAALGHSSDRIQRSGDLLGIHRGCPKAAIRVSAAEMLWLSFWLIHLRPGPFTGGRGPPVRAAHERWWTVVNGVAQYSKACEGPSLPWVQIPPPPPLTCENTGSWQPPGGCLGTPWLIHLAQL